MTNTELITFLAAGDFSDEQAYNLLTADIFDSTSPGQLVRAQATIRYFELELRQSAFPALRFLNGAGRADGKHVAWLVETDFADEDAVELLSSELLPFLGPGQIAAEQGTISYFQGKLREVVFPAIRAAKSSRTKSTADVPGTNAPENVSDAAAPKDSPEVVQNRLDRLSAPEAGE